jgi:hypothetical protein
MKRLDLLATMLALPFGLLGGKNIAKSRVEKFSNLRSKNLPNVETGFVNAVSCGLRTGSGHGEHNAIVIQRAVDDLALVGGTLLIPTGYYEVASPIRLTVTTAEHPTKRVAIVGGDGAILSTPGDNVFATTTSDDAQLSRVEIRGLQFRGSLGKKLPDRG